jgi:hypothetical protein
MARTLPTVTLDQCQQITGMTGNHAAHTVYTTRAERFGVRSMAVGTCPGRHEHTEPTYPDDPFTLIDASD